MSGVVISVGPIGIDKAGGWSLAHVECASSIDSTVKLEAVASGINSVVLGDTRCELPDQLQGLLLHRGVPSGLIPLSAAGLNNALRVLANPIVAIQQQSLYHEFWVQFSFALGPWHLTRLSAIRGVRGVGYAKPSFTGKHLVAIQLPRKLTAYDQAFQEAMVQAVTAGVEF